MLPVFAEGRRTPECAARPRRGAAVCCGWLALCASIAEIATGAAGAQLVINEVVASNVESLVDVDGDAPDWIELYNAGPEPVALEGYGLSDDPDDPLKWIFPRMTIEADDFLVLFASDKDRQSSVNDWHTILDLGDTWRYVPGIQEPPADWTDVDFDDSRWLTGASGFGFGDGDDATEVQTDTIYLRTSFELNPRTVAELQGGYLHVDMDDAFVAYFNGVEIARGGFDGWRRLRPEHYRPAALVTEAKLYQGLTPRGVWRPEIADLARVGENVLAIQGHNSSPLLDPDRDLSIIPFLTLGLQTDGPSGSISPLIEVHPVRLHTNFRLSSEGESVTLSDPFGAVVDRLDFAAVPVDVSVGPQPPAGPDVVFFDPPTPGAVNSSEHRPGFAARPAMTPGGFYLSPVEVTIVAAPGTTVAYTLDASEPTMESELYSGPFVVDRRVSVVRARSFQEGLWPSGIETTSYLLGGTPALPAVSVVVDPEDMFDEETGIYVYGDEYESEWPYQGANFWQDWERPVHVELWELDGSPGFAIDAGIKIHGGYSRAFDQRSLRLIFRGGYGESVVEYPVFPDYDVDEFRRLVLRNSGQDWPLSHLRDALIHALVEPSGLDTQAYRPVSTLINGFYWGIYNLRERVDRFYIESHYGEEEIDLLEVWGRVIEGDSTGYDELIDFVRENDLAGDESYAWVAERMDTEQYAAYVAMQVFFDNADWPDGNIRFWRPRDGGKWRWLLLDTDFGLGLANPATMDSLGRLLDDLTPIPKWATELLRGLLRQPEFEIDFINRYADFLNTWLDPVVTVTKLGELSAAIEPEIFRHRERWGGTYEEWTDEVETIGLWLQERPQSARQHLIDNFALAGSFELTLGLQPAGAGSVHLTAITVDDQLIGTYFKGVPVTLTAEPAPGYAFAGWSDPNLPAEPTVRILPPGDYAVDALFEMAPPPGLGIVINEINYNSAEEFDPGDWIELLNAGNAEVDLGGWAIKDSDDGHIFTLPLGTRIPAQGYLVVCADLTSFAALFPDVTEAIGDLGFGFSGSGDSVRLFEADGDLHDEVAYDDESPWPIEPDGQGPTLELIDPALDNALAESWRASPAAHGTPGQPNGGG